MFLRCHSRKKNGQLHRYGSVVESRRCRGGRPVQRQGLYLGEINDRQEAAWRKTVEVFDEPKKETRPLALFPSDRPVPPEEVNALSVVLGEMRLRRPRSFGDGWLGCRLWEELGLSWFGNGLRERERGEGPWSKVLQLWVVNRWCEPATEFFVHRRWFLRGAMDELLGCDFAVAEKDRLYRRLDRILPHKDELCQFLTQPWKTLLDAAAKRYGRRRPRVADTTSEAFKRAGERRFCSADLEGQNRLPGPARANRTPNLRRSG